VRALETVTERRGITSAGEGWTNLVMTRDRPLRSVNGLITGFHEPRATHLAVVTQVIAAAGGRAQRLTSIARTAKRRTRDTCGTNSGTHI
jgi:S-adenosylmethionine:tRNA-ribosyltransferase-isomerase (queuine synthetase)